MGKTLWRTLAPSQSLSAVLCCMAQRICGLPVPGAQALPRSSINPYLAQYRQHQRKSLAAGLAARRKSGAVPAAGLPLLDPRPRPGSGVSARSGGPEGAAHSRQL